jgi:cytoskeletal protein RodZ
LNLSLADIALRTRVTLRHIEALEAGDYTAMPGRPYAIGFARAYARTVDLDDSDIADAVRAELNGRAPRPESRILNQFEVGDPAKTPSRFVGWLALLLVGAILALGGVFWRSYYAPSVALPSLASKTPQSPANLSRNEVQRPPTPTQSAINAPVIFTALENDVWVKFYDGQGKQLMQKQLAKGESYNVPGDAAGPRIWTGRPDALSITIGGKAIPRLAEVEKIMKDVPVDAASLRARSASPAENPSSPSAGSSSPAL